MRILAALAALTMLSACSIQERVIPVTFAPTATREVCIIEHPPTRTSFRDGLVRALQQRGFQPRVIPENSPLTACRVTTTYLARWSWDFTIYMAYAEIIVFEEGRNVGRATYDARMGGGRLDKWIDADVKIAELVDQLFVVQN